MENLDSISDCCSPYYLCNSISLKNSDDKKTEAQIMATDLSALAACWKSLESDPGEADSEQFMTELQNAVFKIENEYSYLLNDPNFPQNNLHNMFDGFNQSVLNYKMNPLSNVSLYSACWEFSRNQPADLKQYLEKLVSEPFELKNFYNETQNAANAFQKYAISKQLEESGI